VASYRHSQFATPMAVGTVLGLATALAGLALLSRSTLASAPWLVVALFAILLGAFALFWRLVVEVDGRSVRATFGIGLVRKAVPLGDVRRADVIRTRVWWGYGVHWTPSGWLYNVAGRDAVRLELEGGRAVMIGTDEPAALKSAIDAALQALPGR
jgi:hypothetical protein